MMLMVAPLIGLGAAAQQAAAATAAPSCPHPSAPAHVPRAACDVRQVHTANYSACQSACCTDEKCVAV